MPAKQRVPPDYASQGKSRRSLAHSVLWLLGLIEHWNIAWVIVVLNFGGFLAGIVFWYGEQLLLAVDQWFLWPFIPDCPLFAGLFVVAFLGLRAGRDWRLFYTITALGLIKYGVWTVVFSLAYWVRGAPVEPLSLAMCFTHVGMILEGVYVSYRIVSPSTGDTARASLARPRTSPGGSAGERGAAAAGFRPRDVLVALVWFLLSDFVDYGLGHYPLFDPRMAPLSLIQWHTIFMTVALAAVFFVLSKRSSPRGLADRQAVT